MFFLKNVVLLTVVLSFASVSAAEAGCSFNFESWTLKWNMIVQLNGRWMSCKYQGKRSDLPGEWVYTCIGDDSHEGKTLYGSMLVTGSSKQGRYRADGSWNFCSYDPALAKE